MKFSSYLLNSLKQSPESLTLLMSGSKYKAEFQAFSNPENSHKTPVIFLGGAFQSFSSFKYEVELVLSTHPVILVDFPSQGCNDQLAPELGLDDFAELIELFCQALDLNKVMLLGISYGSAMATIFATAYPHRVERLLLSGITCFRRDSLITLLEDSLDQLKQGNMEAFATTAVCNLINYSRIDKTEVSPTYRRLLFRQISRLNENEQARYIQNTERLLSFSGFTEFPSCPTLIATGEFDSFTLPSENAAVAAQCADATFVLVHNADHLSQFERKETTSSLFHHFMCDLPLDSIEGISLHDPHHYQDQEQRLQTRHRPLEQPYKLTDKETGKVHCVRISNINFAGCEIEQISQDLSINHESNQLYLEIPETGNSYHLRIMKRQRKSLRCLIIQRDLKAADSLNSYLNDYYLLSRDTDNCITQELA